MNWVEHCELITNQRQTERRKLPIVCQEMSPLSLKHIFPGLCYFNPSTGTGDLWKMKYEHSIDKKITFKGFWKRRNRSPQESLPEPCKNAIGWIIVIFLLCFKKIPARIEKYQPISPPDSRRAFISPQMFAESLPCTHAERKALPWLPHKRDQ